jgi:two-component system cell cycle response regulator
LRVAPRIAAYGSAKQPVQDSDIKTRVTPLEELKIGSRAGADCLVVIYSSDARQFGKRYVLERETLSIGRGQENLVVLDNDSVSRRHCRIERRSSNWYVVDLDSTNGTYVNDEIVKDYQLRRGDQVKIGDTIMKYLSGTDVEAQYHETIYKMTIIDGLTGAHNKRYLLETLDREIPRSRRHGRPLSVVMFDIDHFKKINDTYGHLAGDYVLKEIATLVRSRLRPDDVFGRYGGEEFCALLPETALAGAGAIAEDLRRRIQERRYTFENEQILVTVSLGAAELDGEMDGTGLLKAADEKLYDAKRGGRNKVCF